MTGRVEKVNLSEKFDLFHDPAGDRAPAGGVLYRAPGVERRPVSDGVAHVMLFGPASTLNTGNVRNERTHQTLGRV